MPASKNIHTYQDVRKILDIAIEREGLRYRVKSPGMAKHVRQRINMFRRLAHEQAVDAQLIPGTPPETPYDKLTTTLEGCDVVIRVRETEGEILALDETPIPDSTDELDEAMAEFKKQLEGEE